MQRAAYHPYKGPARDAMMITTQAYRQGTFFLGPGLLASFLSPLSLSMARFGSLAESVLHAMCNQSASDQAMRIIMELVVHYCCGWNGFSLEQ